MREPLNFVARIELWSFRRTMWILFVRPDIIRMMTRDDLSCLVSWYDNRSPNTCININKTWYTKFDLHSQLTWWPICVFVQGNNETISNIVDQVIFDILSDRVAWQFHVHYLDSFVCSHWKVTDLSCFSKSFGRGVCQGSTHTRACIRSV